MRKKEKKPKITGNSGSAKCNTNPGQTNPFVTKDPLIERILSYLKIKGIGNAISLSCDIPLRRRLARTDNKNGDNLEKDGRSFQDRIADDDLKYLMGKRKYLSIDEPVYKAIELGELLLCLEKYGECKYAKDCWCTRKGFCERRRQEELHND